MAKEPSGKASSLLRKIYTKRQARPWEVRPWVFSPQDAEHIPLELRGATRYDLSHPGAYDNLFRHLTNQPAREKSEVAAQIDHAASSARKQQFSAPLWNVPIPPNPFFTGREKVLADVEKELHAQRAGGAYRNGRSGQNADRGALRA